MNGAGNGRLWHEAAQSLCAGMSAAGGRRHKRAREAFGLLTPQETFVTLSAVLTCRGSGRPANSKSRLECHVSLAKVTARAQSQDHTVRLDRVFGELIDYLDHRIGLQNVLITLSPDHGFMNVPEYSASRRLDAGRIDPAEHHVEVCLASAARAGRPDVPM
jgi:hypothetical protein